MAALGAMASGDGWKLGTGRQKSSWAVAGWASSHRPLASNPTVSASRPGWRQPWPRPSPPGVPLGPAGTERRRWPAATESICTRRVAVPRGGGPLLTGSGRWLHWRSPARRRCRGSRRWSAGAGWPSGRAPGVGRVQWQPRSSPQLIRLRVLLTAIAHAISLTPEPGWARAEGDVQVDATRSTRWWLRTDSRSTEVAGTPEAIYDLIADLSQMGRWSPECHTVDWTGGASARPSGPPSWVTTGAARAA